MISKTLPVSLFFARKLSKIPHFREQVKSLNGHSVELPSDSVLFSGFSSVEEKTKFRTSIIVANGQAGNGVVKRKKGGKDNDFKYLEPLWDDGYGSKSVRDYLDIAKELMKPDGGPPRWFSPLECGCPLEGSPVLLYLPDIDGLGIGLILHHKALGRLFDVRCLHIPVNDRTPFEDLVKFVDDSVKLENKMTPSKPIYFVGDSFGASLALSVAAKNPTIDLILILANPATSFGRSQLQVLLPFVEALPDELNTTVSCLLSLLMGNSMTMATMDVDRTLQLATVFKQLSWNLTDLLPPLSELVDINPKDSLVFKLKMLKSASLYTNSRLHAVTAEVLVLASGNDKMLPSVDEANRLLRSLKNCEVRYFNDSRHSLFLEDGVNLLNLFKVTLKYRRSKRFDFFNDLWPPSMSEYKQEIQKYRLFLSATSPMTFSTKEDGKIVRGLSGVPAEGPVLLVGNHMLLAIDALFLVEEFLREKMVMVHGLAHPEFFTGVLEAQFGGLLSFDYVKSSGAIPLTSRNLYKSLSTKSFTLLYPGGAREALHRKGEGYKLFWPDQPEFVRMAATFGATIVPFGAVGEDDIFELVLDYDDQMKIPVLNDFNKNIEDKCIRLRKELDGELADQFLHFPGVFPKVPGRFYYLFGKPIQTKGMKVMLQDKEMAKELYLEIEHQIEANIAYLMKKRDNDPYRSIVNRILYQAAFNSVDPIPTFDP